MLFFQTIIFYFIGNFDEIPYEIKNFKKISTHLLTVLIIGVILQLEQRKGNKKKEKVPNPQGSGTQHIGFLRQCLNIFYECLLKGDMTYDVT